MHTHAHTHVHIHAHTHVHVHVHTHMHTHVHTHVHPHGIDACVCGASKCVPYLHTAADAAIGAGPRTSTAHPTVDLQPWLF